MDIKIDEIVKQVLSEIDAPSRPVQLTAQFLSEKQLLYYALFFS